MKYLSYFIINGGTRDDYTVSFSGLSLEHLVVRFLVRHYPGGSKLRTPAMKNMPCGQPSISDPTKMSSVVATYSHKKSMFKERT